MNFILIDTSASMSGAPLYQALLTAAKLVDGFSSNDRIAVATFSDRLRPLLGPERARELTPGERKSAALTALSAVKADGNATHLAAALLAAVGDEVPMKLHVISDFQKGATLDRLREEAWPDHLQIIPHPIALAKGWTNAGVRILPPEKLTSRVRVLNSEGSTRADFTLSWNGQPLTVSVPPGENAIFDAPPNLPAAGKVTLIGDDFTFDNDASWTTPDRPVARVWFPGQTAITDTSESLYFLSRALQSTPEFEVEIRDFDEEFYQQSAPPGPPGANPAADLIKTQTGILNSTWNLRRDHTEIAVTPPPAKDLETLRRSQEIAMETAAAMEAEQADPAVRQILTDARLAMKDALAELTLAHEKTSAAPLEPAIGHEQIALRHLYQLKSNKTMMMQSQGEGESSSAEDKPKDDLDLKPMDNPYQAEKEAKPETAGKANEAMEILKRLDELAKRQRDLNEEMQAMQAALNQADAAAKKAEIERQLKQLREQQKELLADVDDLRQKTSDPAQQATEPQQNKALDDAREKARQANEELKDNKLGEALASGRRAEEALEKLHDDFRETSAAQLAEQLRELRKDARALDECQRQLGEPLAPKAPSLTDNRGEAKSEVGQQREDLKKLLDGIRETAETAEKAEPLVARDLAEALRQADQSGIGKSLEQMEQSPAAAASNRAAEGISQLTREIEGAAERILGNEAQALRYARDELQRLADQAAGKPPENGKPGEAGKGQAEASSSSEGQGAGGAGRGKSAITGENFKEWSERLSDLEAVVEDPEAQSAVARARKASRELRKDFKRHSVEPDQAALAEAVLRPLTEAAGKLDARLHELDRKDPLAPVCRDPVPERYAEIVRRYFEELGK